ncbi:hypothetical protein GW17_00014965, partial [Ensete ventricosum]
FSTYGLKLLSLLIGVPPRDLHRFWLLSPYAPAIFDPSNCSAVVGINPLPAFLLLLPRRRFNGSGLRIGRLVRVAMGGSNRFGNDAIRSIKSHEEVIVHTLNGLGAEYKELQQQYGHATHHYRLKSSTTS